MGNTSELRGYVHHTTKPWHFIPNGDGSFIIKCDTSYATAGVMECVFTPGDWGKPETTPREAAIRTLRGICESEPDPRARIAAAEKLLTYEC